jgi:uroporphyrinogen III methyltransferase/synthase
VQPAIEIRPPEDWRPLDAALAALERFDWLVFSSANGVRAVLDRLLATRDLRALATIKLAAIGTASAEELARYHLRADLVPEEFQAESLAAALVEEAAQGKRFLLARASRGREVLGEQLVAHGGAVEQVVVYTSRDLAAPDARFAEQLRKGEIDWVTVTSSAIARSLAQMFGAALQNCRLASISPITSQTLRTLGYQVAAEATVYTMEGVVEAIARHARETPR